MTHFNWFLIFFKKELELNKSSKAAGEGLALAPCPPYHYNILLQASTTACLPTNHSLCTCNPWVRDDYTF